MLLFGVALALLLCRGYAQLTSAVKAVSGGDEKFLPAGQHLLMDMYNVKEKALLNDRDRLLSQMLSVIKTLEVNN